MDITNTKSPATYNFNLTFYCILFWVFSKYRYKQRSLSTGIWCQSPASWLSAPYSPFFACSAKIGVGPLKIFPLPETMLNFVSRGRRRTGFRCVPQPSRHPRLASFGAGGLPRTPLPQSSLLVHCSACSTWQPAASVAAACRPFPRHPWAVL